MLNNHSFKIPSNSLTQEEQILQLIHQIIDDLDEVALHGMLSGNESDLGNLLSLIGQECKNVLVSPDSKAKTSSLDFIPRLSESMEETFRVENMAYFINSCLPEFDMEWFHFEWCNYIKLYQHLGIIASRGLGKSYFGSYAYPIWKMYRYEKPSPLKKVRKELIYSEEGILFTYESGLGKHLIEKIKNGIESSDILREKLFPTNNDGSWAKEKIVCKNGAQFYNKSYGSAARGRHPGYIIVDDFLVENVLYSKDQREKLNEYYFSVIERMRGKKERQILLIGTPFIAEDLYDQLKKPEKRGTYHIFEYPAIFPDGTLTSNKFTFEDILEMKKTTPPIVFSREILCKPISSNSTIFPYEMLSRSFEGMESFSLVTNIISFPMKFKKVVTGCDFAISATVGADYSVFTTFGIDEFENYWLLNVYREKGKSYQEQINVIKEIYSNFRPSVIFLENNQMQQIFVEGAKSLGLPVYGHHTGVNKNDLKTGLPGLAILFQNNKFRLPRGDQYSRDITDTIISEFSSIAYTDSGLKGVGQHDDTVMSCWIAIEASRWKTDLKLHF